MKYIGFITKNAFSYFIRNVISAYQYRYITFNCEDIKLECVDINPELRKYTIEYRTRPIYYGFDAEMMEIFKVKRYIATFAAEKALKMFPKQHEENIIALQQLSMCRLNSRYATHSEWFKFEINVIGNDELLEPIRIEFLNQDGYSFCFNDIIKQMLVKISKLALDIIHITTEFNPYNGDYADPEIVKYIKTKLIYELI